MTRKTIENIKSFILVVLFLTTILLLYLQFGGTGEVKISSIIPDFTAEKTNISAEDYILPSEIIYTSGDGSYKKAKDIKENFERFNAVLKDMCSESSVLATEISREQYSLAIEGYESIQINFGYSISFSEYCRIFGIERGTGLSSVDSADAAAISSAASGSILIKDSTAGKYYRLIPDAGYNTEIEIYPEGSLYDSTYYEAESILGQGGKNLFPLLTAANIPSGSYELKISDAQFRTDIAKAVFGETFDFVRRISDSFGNYTYMYGYGQKTLYLTADGKTEYKAEAGSGDAGSFSEDLETALLFAEKLGLLPDAETSGLVLSDAAENGSGKVSGHTFYFIQTLEGIEIRTGNEYALEISVENGSVINLKSSIIEPENVISGTYRQVTDAANAMAAGASDTREFAYMAENYVSIEPVLKAEEGALTPVWMLRLFGGETKYYDLYTGEQK